MVPQIQSVEDFSAVSDAVHGLAPVSVAAVLAGVSDEALRDRLRRGTLKAWSVNGCLFVCVRECRRGGSLAIGQVVN